VVAVVAMIMVVVAVVVVVVAAVVMVVVGVVVAMGLVIVVIVVVVVAVVVVAVVAKWELILSVVLVGWKWINLRWYLVIAELYLPLLTRRLVAIGLAMRSVGIRFVLHVAEGSVFRALLLAFLPVVDDEETKKHTECHQKKQHTCE